jgi:hypothetical protein
MLFPDETNFDLALRDLAASIAIAPAAPVNPLPCDRWIARSCLQKAVRRAEPELAQRALANLFQHDRRATWRHLTIIALEDVGVANVDILTTIVAAQRNRLWRNQQGGDWPVMVELVRQMAASEHCQAACDLLLRALNDPQLDVHRAAASEMDAPHLAQMLWHAPGAIETTAIAAMALGGGLAEGQQFNDPGAVFDILAEAGRSSHVVETCRAAWKLSRNPMALLLPIVWDRWTENADHRVINDELPSVQVLHGVPGYTLDQFTRVGNAISRDLLREDSGLREILMGAGIASGAYARAVGDLLFLAEGGLLVNRAVWAVGDRLRLPHRALPKAVQLGSSLTRTLRYIDDKVDVIATLRAGHFPSAGV